MSNVPLAAVYRQPSYPPEHNSCDGTGNHSHPEHTLSIWNNISSFFLHYFKTQVFLQTEPPAPNPQALKGGVWNSNLNQSLPQRSDTPNPASAQLTSSLAAGIEQHSFPFAVLHEQQISLHKRSLQHCLVTLSGNRGINWQRSQKEKRIP